MSEQATRKHFSSTNKKPKNTMKPKVKEEVDLENQKFHGDDCSDDNAASDSSSADEDNSKSDSSSSTDDDDVKRTKTVAKKNHPRTSSQSGGTKINVAPRKNHETSSKSQSCGGSKGKTSSQSDSRKKAENEAYHPSSSRTGSKNKIMSKKTRQESSSESGSNSDSESGSDSERGSESGSESEDDCKTGKKNKEKTNRKDARIKYQSSTESSDHSSTEKCKPEKLADGQVNYIKKDADDEDSDSGEDGELINKLGISRACSRDGHVLHTTLYIASLIFFLIWNIAIRPWALGLLIWVVLFYGPFLYEFFNSSTFKYLRNIESSESLKDYYDRLCETAPEIRLHLKMFHEEIRITRDNGHTTTERVKVVTHEIGGTIDIATWHDVSDPLSEDDTSQFMITKVKLSKDYVPNESFQNQISDFIGGHRHLDQFFALDVCYSIDGFKSHFLAVHKEKPKYLGLWWAVLAHVTLIGGLPYRLWMGSISGKIKLEIKKLIYAS